MKRALVTALLLLVGACTGTDGNREPALALADEVERLAGSRSLWPGFEPMAIPLAIYDGEHTYLFRHPAPPEGFVAVGGGERDFHAYEGRHPAVIANTTADVGGTSTATLVLQDSDEIRSLTDLAAVALHEAFHVYQRERHPGWQANEGDLFVYPTDDASLLALRRLETEALRRALAASDSAESTCWANRALALRGERFDQMDAKFAAYERGTEMNEGLATYVELRAVNRETAVLPENGFEATEIRRRAYATGPAFGRLLDRFHPEWPASFESDDAQTLDQALATALGADRGDPSNACAFSGAEIDEAGRIARDDTAAVLETRVERRAAFDTRPGWRLVVVAADSQPLWPQGFDPLNIRRVEGGFLHTRFVRLGNDSGHLEALDSGEADLDALTEGVGPHPLYNGIQRVVIAGLAEPVRETEGDRIDIQAPGFTASFEGARVRESATELVVVLQPAE